MPLLWEWVLLLDGHNAHQKPWQLVQKCLTVGWNCCSNYMSKLTSSPYWYIHTPASPPLLTWVKMKGGSFKPSVLPQFIHTLCDPKGRPRNELQCTIHQDIITNEPRSSTSTVRDWWLLHYFELEKHPSREISDSTLDTYQYSLKH